MSQAALKSLTSYMVQAESGLKKDVSSLIENLPEGGFYLSLATSLGLADENIPPAPEVTIGSHLLKHPDDSLYVCLFTDSELARNAQKLAEWESDKGTQELCILPARNALYYAYKLMESNEQIVGTFINPYAEKGSVQLNIFEIQSLFSGNAIPFEAYARLTPMGPEESLMVRPADVSSAPEFIEALAGFLKATPVIERHEIVAVFDEERDLNPYLAVNFHTTESELDFPDLANQFVKAIEGKIPERLEVMFNEKLPGML